MEVSLHYAGFWKRFAAYIIDYVILAFFLYFTFKMFMDRWDLNFIARDIHYHPYYQGYSDYPYYYPPIWSTMLYPLFALIIRWCYFSGLESSPLKATIGKLAVGIYVTDLKGERISFGKATGRYFGKIISRIILGVGFIMAGFTEKKQALHDMMANCLVLSK